MNPLRLLSLTALGGGLFSVLPAQTGPVVELDPMVVVGTRTMVPLDQHAPAVGLRTAEELATQQWVSVADALGAWPGFHVATSGQEGALASLFTRGSNSDHTAILFEGRRLPIGFSGIYGLSFLDLDPGLNLEVSRGPGSFLYGADAIGGVINLVGGRNLPAPGASSGMAEVTAGSFGAVGGRVQAATAGPGWSAEVGLGGRETDNDAPNSASSRRHGRLAFRAQPAAGWTVDLQALGWTSELGLPDNRKAEGYPKLTDFQDDRGGLVSPGVQWENAEWRVAAFAIHAEDRLEARNTFVFGGSAFPSEDIYRSQTQSVEVQMDHRLAKGWLVSAGAASGQTEFDRQDLLAGGATVVDETAETWGAWAQVQAEVTSRLGLAAGVRVDDYSSFDTPVTGSAQAAWRLSDTHSLFVRFGTAYAAPQAFDLYGLFGNPNLAAEQSESIELGWRGRWGRAERAGRIEATIFRATIDDLIVYDPAIFQTANVGRAVTEGLELVLSQAWAGGWSTYGHYSYLTAENRRDGTRLLRRPRHVAFAGTRWTQDGLSLAAEARWVAGREDVDGGTFARVDSDDYTVVRLLASWNADDAWTLFGRIENLLDERYDEVDGYAALGRGVHVGVRRVW